VVESGGIGLAGAWTMTANQRGVGIHLFFRGIVKMAALFMLVITPAVSALLPDSSWVRQQYLDRMTDPMQQLPEPLRDFVFSATGDSVLVRTYEQQGHRYFVFIHPHGDEEFEIATPGTWIVRRNRENGDINQIKIFLQADEGSYIRLQPHGRNTRMEVSLGGYTLYRNIPVPISMTRALSLPFETLQRATTGLVDWDLVLVDPTDYRYQVVADLAGEVRGYLRYLPDAEDGAIDEAGSFIFIETLRAMEDNPGLNCSGFAKWVIDGMYHSRTGSWLPVADMRRKHLDLRGTPWSVAYEDQRDPWFGLDWTRNLATAMAELDRGPGVWDHPQAQDITSIPVAGYLPNVGYAVEDLPGVFYWLALKEPGNIYLGSVNRSFGTAPVLRQHSHVVVFFPYFDERGSLQVVVMERNVESGLPSLQRRYRGDFVHLVRVPAALPFTPPTPFLR